MKQTNDGYWAPFLFIQVIPKVCKYTFIYISVIVKCKISPRRRRESRNISSFLYPDKKCSSWSGRRRRMEKRKH